MGNLIKYLKYTETIKLNECFEFFKNCLVDQNRWVKNQVLIQYGPIVNELYLKIKELPEDAKEQYQQPLKDLIKKYTETYYDTKMIFGTSDDKGDIEDSLMNKLDEYSFMQNKSDDVDKIRYYWAYNLPCAIMVNGGNEFWFQHLKNIYELLYKDILINVRTAMSSGFKEIIELLDITSMKDLEEKKFFVTVLNHYLKDTDEKISQKVLPTICSLISKFPD